MESVHPLDYFSKILIDPDLVELHKLAKAENLYEKITRICSTPCKELSIDAKR